MKTLIFVSFCVLILTFPQYGQTQLLKVGNAIQYSDEGNYEWIIVTTKLVTIDGKEYFERKSYSPWYTQSVFIKSWERIEGDSTYFVLNANNQDSLIFNFNWRAGKKYFTSTNGNIFSGQRIDSIRIVNTFLNDDTVYVLRNFTYNTTTGDTSFNVIPEYDHLSKKIGKLDGGMWTYATGVKINGTRYGEVYPYPEEIVFSEDSLYSEFIGDTVNCYISNTSDYDVVLDSIYTTTSDISGYFSYGYLMYLIRNNNYFFINLFDHYPNHPLDTLNYIIPAHDSIQLQIYDIDLCPICKKKPTEYFEDTLKFVFTFSGGSTYSFNNTIRISGEGHPSDVTDDKILPAKFVLEQNYPNPFNPSTVISYQLPVSSQVTLKVYDVLGNEIATLVNEEKPAGSHEISLNASQLSSGVYYYQLRSGYFVETKKMILLR